MKECSNKQCVIAGAPYYQKMIYLPTITLSHSFLPNISHFLSKISRKRNGIEIDTKNRDHLSLVILL